MITRTPLTAQELAQIVKIGQEIFYTPHMISRKATITNIAGDTISIVDEYTQRTLTLSDLEKCGAKTLDGTQLYHIEFNNDRV